MTIFNFCTGGIFRLLVMLVLISSGVYGQPHPSPTTGGYTTGARIRSAIHTILSDSVLTKATVGIKIVALRNGAVLFKQNENKLFHPASTLKLVTAATALHRLGPGYRFLTTVSAHGSIQGHTLKGDIVVRGTGDPLLTVADFDSLITEIKAKGIETITGDLIGNRTLFDSISWGAGWMWDDEPSSDEPFITPLSVEGNSILFTVTPGNAAGSVPAFEQRPTTSYITVRNEGTTSDDTLIPPLLITRNHGENLFRISGRLAPNSLPSEYSVSVANPDLYFLTLFKEHLLSHGIRWTGIIRVDTVTGNRDIVRSGHTLDSVLYFMDKSSNNLAAENLLRTIGIFRSGPPGSVVNGIAAVGDYLAECGIDTASLHIADGSGVSWYNIITPDAMVKLLASEYRHKKTFPVFYESLPVGGVDGTLKSRFRGSRAEGNVHAKTGSLSGVSTLTGYVGSADHQMVAFCIMCDHYPGNINELRKLQDWIVDLLAGSHLKK